MAIDFDRPPPCSVRRPRARPRFGFDLPLAPEEVVTRLKTRLDAAEGRLEGSVFSRTVLVNLPKHSAKFWSPFLDVQVEERPEGGSRLCACFSPHPQIWTGFIAAQALMAILAIAAGVYGLSLSMLGQSTLLAFGAMGAFLVGGGLIYGGAYIGQGLGSDEMYELRAFVEEAVEAEGPEASGVIAGEPPAHPASTSASRIDVLSSADPSLARPEA